MKQTTQKTWECTEEGSSLATNGSHEARLFNSLTSEGCPIADIKVNFPNANIALGAAMKNKVRQGYTLNMYNSVLFCQIM